MKPKVLNMLVFPPAEAARQSMLLACALLDSDPEPGFDAIVDLAAELLDAPIAMVSLVDCDRQWFKATHGIDATEAPRSMSFCAHAILTPDVVMVVPDAKKDSRFADNPLVHGPQSVRFYAGVPLVIGVHAIGTLCVIDTKPRPGLSKSQAANLQRLATLAVDRIEIVRAEQAQRAGHGRFEAMLARSPVAAICADHDNRIISWNDAASALFGYSAAEAIGASLDIVIPERHRGPHRAGTRRVADTGVSRLAGRAVEIPGLHRDGHEIPIEISLSMWRESGVPTFGALIRDITDRTVAQEHLHRLAFFDPLTGLPNRRSLTDLLETTLARKDASAALLLLDLDGFKDVNDSLGHGAGDELLTAAACRLAQAIGPDWYGARVGGDEFAVVMPDTNDLIGIGIVSQAVLDAFKAPFDLAGTVVYVSTSIGVALAPAHGVGVEQLMVSADLALYCAKARGGGVRHFYMPGMRDGSQMRREISTELRTALEDGELELLYQPQIRLEDGHCSGAEALLRWRHPEHGLLSPAAFLSVLDSGPMAADVGNWVVTSACAQLAAWAKAGLPDLCIAVNLSAAQLRCAHIVDVVRDALAAFALDPWQLELEITETTVLKHDAMLLDVLVELRALGVGLAFDDFGTGYASLSLLKRFPLSKLKIDRSFVEDLADNAGDRAIVRAVIAIGQSLGLGVIAEGVETEAQERILKKLGCRDAQGFRFGRPMSAGHFIDWFGARSAPPVRHCA